MLNETTTEFIARIGSTADAWLIKAVHLFASSELLLENLNKQYKKDFERIILQKKFEP